MSRRLFIGVLALALAVGAWVLLFQRFGRPAKRWQTKPPVNQDASRPAKTARPKSLAESRSMAEIMANFSRSGAPKLSREQVETYADDQGRDAQSLVVAARLTGDVAYLEEAALSFPGDPMVLLEIALNPSVAVEERRAALELHRAVEPDNSLGDYLGAHWSFSQGDYAGAAQGLLASLEHGTLTDHSDQVMAGAEQAYLSAGFDPLSAQFASMATLSRPTLTPLREVTQHLDSLKDEFIKANDIDAAEPAVLIGIDIGQKLQGQAPYLIDQLVGMSIERSFLEQLDPLTPVGSAGQTAFERLALIEAQKNDVASTAAAFGDRALKMDAATSAEYFRRLRRDGELSAMKWALNR